MKIIDTHTHIYSKEFDSDRSNIIRRAKEAGVKAVLLPNEDSGSIEPINRLCEEEPGFAYPMIGLHPTCVNNSYTKEIRAIEQSISKHKYYAIGEIGIDLYWDKSFFKEQKLIFEEQLQWSIDLQLPIAIHTRNSFNEVLDSIHKVGANKLKGVFHCFGGTMEEWNEISKLTAFYVGIGGIVTYKNSALNETLKHIPVEKIVFETDAPYLAPTPYRGKRNEPSYILETAKKVAECHNIKTEDMVNYSYQNSLRLFNISINNTDI